MIKTRIALFQLISGTCDKAKKYRGDRNKEKGKRSNFMVEAESTWIVFCKLGLLQQPIKTFKKKNGNIVD
ncbi:MAG: hypothetical protein ACSLE0_00520 [Chitinophagaceae bacterium]